MVRSIFIPIMLALAALPALGQESSWIGISIEDQKDRGAIVRNVDPNSPAGRAGLKEGDVITEFNKQDVIGAQQLTRLIRETPVGRTVEIKVRRDNRDQTFHVTTERSNLRSQLDRFELDIPGIRILRERGRDFPQLQVNTAYVQSGIRVESLTDQLRDFFGVYSNNGVLVTSVNKDSAAEKAGLKAGDVIVSIDGRNIRTPAEFSREMRSASSKATLKIIRDKQDREIKLE